MTLLPFLLIGNGVEEYAGTMPAYCRIVAFGVTDRLTEKSTDDCDPVKELLPDIVEVGRREEGAM